MITRIRHALAVFILSLITFQVFSQQQVTLMECYSLARRNYPLIKKQALLSKSSRFSLENASRVFYPQLSFTGQASYQSQTIDFGEVLPAVPGLSLPQLSKDQYRIQADLSQQLYDGGAMKNQKALIAAGEQVQEQSLEVSLSQLKDRVNQLFFSILLMDEQLKQNAIKKVDLQGVLDKAIVALNNGTGYKSITDELSATLVSVEIAAIEFRSARKAYSRMLSLLTGRDLGNASFILPEKPSLSSQLNRPELRLFELQKNSFTIQQQRLKTDLRPKVSAFVQGAYGRPTLNIIENKFGPWWLGGLRLNWQLGSIYTQQNNRAILDISRQNLDVDKESFVFNTNILLSQQNAEIEKFQELLVQDDAVILLRSSVLKAARSQLDNGVITVHEYIAKLNEESLARQARIVHNIQLTQAQFNYNNTSGN